MKMRVVLLGTFAAVLSASTAHAAAGPPVVHNHEGRSHSHPLPASGKNHSHGGAKKKAPVTNHDKDNAILVKDGWNPLSKSWYYVASSSTHLFTVKDGSAVTEGAYRTMVMQQHIRLHKKDKNVSIFTSVVKISSTDCNRGMGEMKVFELNGKLKFTTDFVNDGSSTGDSIGKHICAMAS